MSEVTSSICGFAALLLFASTTPNPITLDNTNLLFGEDNPMNISTASRSYLLPGETKNWQELRAKQIRLLRGKYRDLLTPTNEFIKQKIEETTLEG